ncbi:glycosyltransferase family 2 protein, partial [Dankookia rubra]
AEAGQAVADFLRATGQAAAGVAPCPPPAAGALPLRVHWPLPGPPPLASVIVPTRDHPDLLARCAEGVLQDTAYAPLELLVIDNGSTEPATHALLGRLRQDPRVRVLDAPGPFNYAALNNRAVAAARGEVLVLLNNDVAVIEPGWLGEMVAHALRPGIGAVGARLLYADGRVQHGGVVLGVGGVASHYHPFAGREDPGYHGALRLVRRVAAVTAACLAMRRTVFEAVGGLDAEHLAVAFNDVDLCLRIRAAGHAIVWTPHAELYHLESVSRGFDGAPQNRERFAREVAYMRGRWGPALDADPYYSPNFSLQDAGFNLAFPPRRPRRWEAGGVAPPGAPPEAPPGAPPEAPPGAPPEAPPGAPPEAPPGAPPEAPPGVLPEVLAAAR